ncbi:MAG TPA: TlpA disulfide reductase family protein [Syntrophobacter fumaroxidans]|nr:TlpA disulfide reductase family protein [Syntrophobacter fumaroxidans]
MNQRGYGAVWLVILAIAAGMAFVPDCRAAGGPPGVGGVLPEIALPPPQRMEEVQYLGLKEKVSFKIPETRAEVVIVEIFSMYCPFCQKEAPAVNQLYQIIANRPDLKDKVKIIGIGAGNSQFEVNAFRDLYRIAFPLFPDTDFSIHKLLGEVRTPYFIVIRIKPDKTHSVIYSQVGAIGDPGQFLEKVLSTPAPGKGV